MNAAASAPNAPETTGPPRVQSAPSPAPAAPVSPAQAAIARASARSAERSRSAPSPSPAGSAAGDTPPWDDLTPPDDDHYPIEDDAFSPPEPAAQKPSQAPGTGQPASDSIPKGLPSDLPDIVMDDFPAPPPAAMPTFLAPPPREAPTSGTPARSETRPDSFARLAQSRGAVQAPPEPVLDVEREHELVSRDDPLALDARGVGLDVVLEVLNGRVVEEVVEES